MNSIEVLHRRILVFEFWTCRHISPNKIVEILKKREVKGVTLRTVQRDIRTMKEWLPEIAKIQEDSKQVTADMLGQIRVAKQRLLNLAETADNSSAQVGALRANVEAIVKETDIRFRTGQINAVPEKVEGQHTIILKMWKPDAKTGNEDGDGDKVPPS